MRNLQDQTGESIIAVVAVCSVRSSASAAAVRPVIAVRSGCCLHRARIRVRVIDQDDRAAVTSIAACASATAARISSAWRSPIAAIASIASV